MFGLPITETTPCLWDMRSQRRDIGNACGWTCVGTVWTMVDEEVEYMVFIAKIRDTFFTNASRLTVKSMATRTMPDEAFGTVVGRVLCAFRGPWGNLHVCPDFVLGLALVAAMESKGEQLNRHIMFDRAGVRRHNFRNGKRTSALIASNLFVRASHRLRPSHRVVR